LHKDNIDIIPSSSSNLPR